MSAWLAVQFAYAATAWWYCARAVAFSERMAIVVGRPLAATIRELHERKQSSAIPALGQSLHLDAVADLLELDPASAIAEQFVERANAVARSITPPVRLLRATATIGTMLGLLASVSNLHGALDNATTSAIQAAAGRAFDSAIVGFVSALPCWTAASLCGRRARRTEIELESVILELTRSPTDPSAPPDRASTTSSAVDSPTDDR